MTKRRAPLTAELALIRIADQIGFEAMAAIAEQSDRTVRNWSDPDTKPAAEDAISLGLARKLDTAYRAEGGEGSPLLQWLTTRLEADLAAACADSAEIGRLAARAALESGQAISAAIAASLPGADDADRAIAEKELEESIAAQTNTLATLRAGRKGEVQRAVDSEGTSAANPGEGD